MKTCLSQEAVNAGRQPELDIARGLAVLFMVLIHAQQYFATPEAAGSWMGELIGFLGGIPAAPVFMFLLGAGVVYSRKSDAKTMAYRGLMLIIMGYALNAVRALMPNGILAMTSADGYYLHMALEELAYVDIFQFSGLAMLALAVAKASGKPLLFMVAAVPAVWLAQWLLAGIEVTGASAMLADLMWGVTEKSFFPFLSWIVYPFGGYIFGTALIRCVDKNTLYLRVGIAAGLTLIAIAVVAPMFLDLDLGMGSETGYYQHGWAAHIAFTAFVLLWLALLFGASRWIKGHAFTALKRWSKNVTAIYVIHWVIISALRFLIPFESVSLGWTLALCGLIFLASDAISALLDAKKSKAMR